MTGSYRVVSLQILSLCVLLTGNLLFDSAGNSRAEALSIPNPPNTEQGVLRPTRGMTMDAVLTEFGEPVARKKPVGEPPITRWEYAEFIVNFERSWVIHSAIKRKR